MAEGELIPSLPFNPAPHVTDWLFDIGPTAGGDGLSWRDMVAWQEITGVELMPWEARAIRALSSEYASERFEARKPDRPMPYNGEVEEMEARRAAIADKVDRLFANV